MEERACRVPRCPRSSVLVRHRGFCRYHYELATKPVPGVGPAERLWGKNEPRRRRCGLCGWEGSVHRHRLVPATEGGLYTRSNVVYRCPNCHAGEHGRGEFNLALMWRAFPSDIDRRAFAAHVKNERS